LHNIYPHQWQSRGGVRFSPPFVCLSVFPHDISKTDAAKITKLDNDESWKPIYFGVRRSKVEVTSQPMLVFALL